MAEAGLFQRASLIIRCNVSDLLSKYEDPAKEIDIIIYDMKKELAKLKQQSAVPFGEEGRAKMKYESFLRDAKEWEAAATNAVKAGNEADGRKCFDNFQNAKAKAEKQKQSLDTLVAANEDLRKQIQTIIDDISQMETKAGEIKALAATAKATNMATGMKSGISSGKHKAMFDKMEAKAHGELEAARSNAEFEFGNKGTDDDLKAKYSAGAGDADFAAFMANVKSE